MQIKGNRKLFFISAAILLLLAVAVAVILLKSQRDALYIKVEQITVDISGSRVLIDGVKVGELRLEEKLPDQNFLYRMDFEQKVNIPKRSAFKLTTDNQSRVVVKVDLNASNDYFHRGDTIHVVKLDPDLPSGLFFVSSDNEEVVEPSPIKPEVAEPPIEFRVQILASREELNSNSNKFMGKHDIKHFEEEGWYKYYVGPYSEFEEAKRSRTELKEAGLKDAFITAYRGTKRISVEDALK
ncbi:MAG: SPOR domain-containing protein [Bacteroidetes bacterium]|nr:SPOR domain-containing protein [Bacteroidota bacterium]